MIEEINGVASFAENGAKERAWHELGVVFDGEMTVETALAASHADYTVAKTPVYYQTKNGGFAANPEFFHIIREDNGAPLGLVKKSYGVVQNADAFQFVNNLCAGGDAAEPFIESAGVLDTASAYSSPQSSPSVSNAAKSLEMTPRFTR